MKPQAVSVLKSPTSGLCKASSGCRRAGKEGEAPRRGSGMSPSGRVRNLQHAEGRRGALHTRVSAMKSMGWGER